MYQEYSTFYDEIYEGERMDSSGVWEEDRNFWLNQTKESGSPVLELACGSGRLAIPMANTGLSIHGIDNSPEMLALLEERWNRVPDKKGSLTWELASMSEENKNLSDFRLVFVAISALQYLHTRSEQEKTFANSFSALKSGGKFIIDIFNPNPNFITTWGQKILMKQVQSRNDPNLQITWFCVPKSFDEKSRIIDMPNRFVFKTPTTQQELTLSVRYYCYTKEELEGLFLGAGFKEVTTFGGYNMEPFAVNSKRIIMLGTK